ncbi:hypothetical protein AB4Z52_21775 [Rhizobium sp. 2YAF20]|uniref:hypothetical protein n=1 Tax=Rhizobium sp. 2YAF20 TaxID=3233027 RepID=UPI003F99964F
MLIGELTLCQNVLQRFDDDRRSISLAFELVDDVSKKVVELLEQLFRALGSFGHDRRSCSARGPTLLPILVRRKELAREPILDGCLDQGDLREYIAAVALAGTDVFAFLFKPLHGFEQFDVAHRGKTIGEITGIKVCLIGHTVTPSIDISRTDTPQRELLETGYLLPR